MVVSPQDPTAQRLRILRGRTSLTQAAMAAKLGIGVRSYKFYELGLRPLPVSVALQICADLHVSLNWLLLGREEAATSAVLDLAETSAEAVMRLSEEAQLSLSTKKTAYLIRLVLTDALSTGAKPNDLAGKYLSLLS